MRPAADHLQLIRELMASSDTFITRGSTYGNRSNLAAAFYRQVIGKYEGTRLGRQEIYGEILGDAPGALWNREWSTATAESSGRTWCGSWSASTPP